MLYRLDALPATQPTVSKHDSQKHLVVKEQKVCKIHTIQNIYTMTETPTTSFQKLLDCTNI